MLVLLAKIKSIVYGNLGSSALARVLVAVNDYFILALPAVVRPRPACTPFRPSSQSSQQSEQRLHLLFLESLHSLLNRNIKILHPSLISLIHKFRRQQKISRSQIIRNRNIINHCDTKQCPYIRVMWLCL